MRDPFARCHPIVNLAFFILVVVCTMAVGHPAAQALSFCGALAYAAVLRGRSVWRTVRALLPVMLIAAVLNPLWNHRGATPLFYLPTGNPVTLEALLYGLYAALMLGSVLLWSLCMSSVMTADRWTALFGRAAPSFALLLAMTLRFVPHFLRRFRAVMSAQGIAADKRLRTRVSRAVRVLSIVVTWSMYDAVDTADSMKARGYGQAGRTTYHIYRFTVRDAFFLALILLCAGGAFAGPITGTLDVSFFSRYGAVIAPVWGVVALCCAALLYASPLLLRGWEDVRWLVTQSAR